jgi:membrane protein YqaA with SNARE-associated domain
MMKLAARTLENIANGRRGLMWIGFLVLGLNFADASFLPMPAQTVLMLTLLMYPEKTFRFFSLSVAGTVAGAAAGFLIGRLIVEGHTGVLNSVIRTISHVVPGLPEMFSGSLNQHLSDVNIKVLFIGCFTPVPYVFFSTGAGITGMNFIIFLLITTVGQLFKFYVISFIVAAYGRTIIMKVRQNVISVIRFLMICIVLMVIIPWS